MATFEGKITYSSLSGLDKENSKSHGNDDSEWALPEDDVTISKRKSLYDFPIESDDFIDEGCESEEEASHSMGNDKPPEVNLKNVMAGIFSILTGQNKGLSLPENEQSPSSNVSFLGSSKNGDSIVTSSVYMPSAPPLLQFGGFNYNAYKEVLEAEPPEWLPDSSATVCMQCTAPFTAITRGRHHCRFCGGIFCRICSKGRCLLPAKFRERNPQRLCDVCYDRLEPLQGILINSISNATQVAKHDVMDWTCTRGWLNLPVGMSMENEIYKASNALRSYCQVKF